MSEREPQATAVAEEAESVEEQASRLLDQTPEPTRHEAQVMLENPRLIEEVLADAETLGVAGERALVGTLYLVGVSRLLSRPLAAIVQGPSASGKSYVIEKIADLFPREAVLGATRMSPRALCYMEPGSLRHRFVIAGERSRLENDDTAEATRVLREMLSAGRLSTCVTVKGEGGRFATDYITQEGPIAYVESTTLAKIFDEDLNRCLLLTTDERPEQTRRIITSLAAATGDTDPDRVRAVIDKHHAAQRTLAASPARVKIDWAGRLADRFPDQRTEARRAFAHLLSAIKASALLHRFQRPADADDEDTILAVAEDYRIARSLLNGPLGRSLGNAVSDAALRFLARLRQQLTGQFTTTAACQGVGVTDKTVRGWLSELAEAGLVELLEPNKGPRPAMWKLPKDPPEPLSCMALPQVEEVCPE